VERQGDLVLFTVEGDGFLYNMVRIMVGTLLEIAAGRLAEDSIPAILESGDRGMAGPTAPAHGLCLEQVFYDHL
jgi:tRNA pseudouridine38-40 synthase